MWKCRLQNFEHFVSASFCLGLYNIHNVIWRENDFKAWCFQLYSPWLRHHPKSFIDSKSLFCQFWKVWQMTRVSKVIIHLHYQIISGTEHLIQKQIHGLQKYCDNNHMIVNSWWCHQMPGFSALRVIGEFPWQRASNADVDVSLIWVGTSC